MVTEHAGYDRDARIAVIGAGFGGLGAARALAADGYRNLVVFDARDEVGGTWSANRYPGVACDAPSHVYSYSNGPRYAWARRFADGAQIQRYLHDCVIDAGLLPHLSLGTTVTAASWTGRDWLLELQDGQTSRFDFVVCATGQLSVPALADIPGLADFQGAVLHTARWPTDANLTGRRVAVIGTGASAIQVIPEIVETAAHVTVFQRSAPYVFPKADRTYSPDLHRLYRRAPILRRLVEKTLWVGFELVTAAFWKWPRVMRLFERRHAAVLADTVTDPSTRQALTPDYRAGCKRILISSTYHACFNRDDVRLETAPITAVDTGGIRTADAHHEVDVIICATGFETDTFVSTLTVIGRDGISLPERWSDGARAFLGISVPGFPNFFLVYGPNTNLGSGSIVYMLETQAEHIRTAIGLAAAAARPSSLEVNAGSFDAYSRKLVRRMSQPTVWNSGCRSWYRDGAGRDVHNWHGFMSEYRRSARRARAGDYTLTALPARGE